MISGGNLLGFLPGCPLFCFAQLQCRSLCSSKVDIGSADICNTISVWRCFFSFSWLQLVVVALIFWWLISLNLFSHSRLCQAMGVDEKSILEKVVWTNIDKWSRSDRNNAFTIISCYEWQELTKVFTMPIILYVINCRNYRTHLQSISRWICWKS